MQKILLVEDDRRISDHLTQNLTQAGHLVEVCTELQDAVNFVDLNRPFDLIILDRLFGDQDSKALIPFFKLKWKDCFLIIISAINTPEEKSNLLDLGADDYLGKPFATTELLSRIKALFRRKHQGNSNYLLLGNTLVDFLKRTISVDGKEDNLTAKEFMVLKVLCQEPGRAYSKNEFFELAWGGNSLSETNVVEATVTHLRRKLENAGSKIQLKNMRNAGYWIET